jgi:hypothetical protein
MAFLFFALLIYRMARRNSRVTHSPFQAAAGHDFQR